MKKGISIHIGVDNLDPAFYKNTRLTNLKSCVNDATQMHSLAESKGFAAHPVMKNVGKKEFKDCVRDIAKNHLVSGDIFLITFSGHGGQINDFNFDERWDKFQKDETWCFNDGVMTDDEILSLWTDFNEGVRILVISDSCHSGGVIDLFKIGISNQIKSTLIKKGFDFSVFENTLLYEIGIESSHFSKKIQDNNFKILEELKLREKFLKSFSVITKELKEQQVKSIPKKILQHLCFVENKDKFEKDQKNARKDLFRKLNKSSAENIRELKKASIISISACEDWKKTRDGKDEKDNGDFTKALLDVWRDGNGAFNGGYYEFRSALNSKLKSMNRTQKPGCYPTGEINDNFINENPFTI